MRCELASAQIVPAGFRLRSTGPTARTYVLQASTNLTDWEPVLTSFSTDGTLEFVDPKNTTLARRFFRIFLQP